MHTCTFQRWLGLDEALDGSNGHKGSSEGVSLLMRHEVDWTHCPDHEPESSEPQGLKPASFVALSGTAKAVPFPWVLPSVFSPRCFSLGVSPGVPFPSRPSPAWFSSRSYRVARFRVARAD